jgi:hypothetical protein
VNGICHLLCPTLGVGQFNLERLPRSGGLLADDLASLLSLWMTVMKSTMYRPNNCSIAMSQCASRATWIAAIGGCSSRSLSYASSSRSSPARSSPTSATCSCPASASSRWARTCSAHGSPSWWVRSGRRRRRRGFQRDAAPDRPGHNFEEGRMSYGWLAGL